MRHDLHFALRMILARRWFSLAVVVTMASGIGVNTMVFTLTNAVFFKPLAVHGGDRLVRMHMQSVKDRFRGTGFADTEFREYRASHSSFEALEAGRYERATLTDSDAGPQSIHLFEVSPGMFTALDIAPIRGRGFTPADAEPGAPATALLGSLCARSSYSGIIPIALNQHASHRSKTSVCRDKVQFLASDRRSRETASPSGWRCRRCEFSRLVPGTLCCLRTSNPPSG